eukprot:UN2260
MQCDSQMHDQTIMSRHPLLNLTVLVSCGFTALSVHYACTGVYCKEGALLNHHHILHIAYHHILRMVDRWCKISSPATQSPAP